MRRIINRVGSSKGQKSVTIIIKKQNSNEPDKVLTVTKTTTPQIYNAFLKFTETLEDKIEVSKAITILRGIKGHIDVKEFNKAKRLVNDAIRKLDKL